MKHHPDHDHAPRFRVTYTIPAHKCPRAPARPGEPIDQASKLRERCRSLHRVAGEFTAWTEAEAITAAIAADKIPGGALNVSAARIEEADAGLFAEVPCC